MLTDLLNCFKHIDMIDICGKNDCGYEAPAAGFGSFMIVQNTNRIFDMLKTSPMTMASIESFGTAAFRRCCDFEIEIIFGVLFDLNEIFGKFDRVSADILAYIAQIFIAPSMWQVITAADANFENVCICREALSGSLF